MQEPKREKEWATQPVGRPRYVYPSLMARLAYVYIGALLALQVLLFAASLLLHLSVFISGPNEAYAKFGPSLFRASVFVGSPLIAFVRNGMWTDQIKSCPKWMWKGALGLGVYSLLIVSVQ